MSIEFDEYLAAEDTVTLVELPERGLGHLPERSLLIEIQPISSEHRRLCISPFPEDAVWVSRIEDLCLRL